MPNKDKNAKKKCFIITPIGDEDAPIRRHIDGIIDAVIVPTLDEEFEIIVSHRICESGPITKQIIESIKKADLVIANITNRNPNVMYELAIRHCLGTPTIMIAEKNTALPADIISERTIFYRDDAQGVLDLQKDIQDRVKKIDYEKKESVVYDLLGDIISSDDLIAKTKIQNPKDAELLEVILKKINSLESIIREPKNEMPINYRYKRIIDENNYSSNDLIKYCPDKDYSYLNTKYGKEIKVKELAEELGIPIMALIKYCKKFGIDVTGASDTLSCGKAVSMCNSYYSKVVVV